MVRKFYSYQLKIAVPKLAYVSFNLVIADTALHYNQHAAAIICITNNFNLMSYYT
jgi:hypothetical protein